MGKLRLGHLSLSLLHLHAFELGGERPDGVGLGRHIGPAILISRWTWVCLHTETDIICSAVGGGKVGEYLGGACLLPCSAAEGLIPAAVSAAARHSCDCPEAVEVLRQTHLSCLPLPAAGPAWTQLLT